jgi:hypothetical protein
MLELEKTLGEHSLILHPSLKINVPSHDSANLWGSIHRESSDDQRLRSGVHSAGPAGIDAT